MTEYSVTWKDYVEVQLCAIKESIKTAKESMEHRLEGMNEFRDSLRDQTRTYVTKSEFDSLCARVDEIKRDIHALDLSREKLAGKADQSTVSKQWVVTIISVALAILSLISKFL